MELKAHIRLCITHHHGGGLRASLAGGPVCQPRIGEVVHIKFTRHGTGSAAHAVAYLLGQRDHQGRVRDHVQILIGDPAQVAAVADSLGTVQRYSSRSSRSTPTTGPPPPTSKPS
jgi:hypothetical protein